MPNEKAYDGFLEFYHVQNGQRIAMMTAYDYTSARLVEEAGMDVILVGDSLGMVMLGHEHTLQVTMADMLHHTRAVSRGPERQWSLRICAFLSYHISVEEAVRNAGRFVRKPVHTRGGWKAAENIAPQISAILNAQIPVLGHLGLTPQSVHRFGGFKVQGKEGNRCQRLDGGGAAIAGAGGIWDCAGMYSGGPYKTDLRQAAYSNDWDWSWRGL